MVRNVSPLFAELEAGDFYLLSGLEHGMRFSEWVDRGRLPSLSGLTAEEVEYRLGRALKRGLTEKRTIQYEGYKLTFEGYDALALWAFAERDVIDGVGAKLGVGKESDVYEVRSYRPMALKFHREGIGNFRNLNREREYTADRRHVSDLYTARIAAEREFEALETLYPSVAVPQPIEHNRHAIIMEKLDGVELSKTTLDTTAIKPVFIRILTEVAKAYNAGLVHADLSEYNVFVGEDRIAIFDWPQFVQADHPNADELLDRDVSTIRNYFRRKYPDTIPDALDITDLVDAVRTNRVKGAIEAVDG